MGRINILVEGPTEEDFVNAVLREPFAQKGIALAARSVETSRKHGKINRGGATNYLKFRRDLLNWLNQDEHAVASMMFDLYALPNDFPSYTEAHRQADSYQRVALLEQALLDDINRDIPSATARFIPYIQLHEFESLLFSDPAALNEGLSLLRPAISCEKDLRQILAQAQNNPEL